MVVLRVLYLHLDRVWLCQYNDDIRADLRGPEDMQVQCTHTYSPLPKYRDFGVYSMKQLVSGENVYFFSREKTGWSVLSYETRLRTS